MRVDLHAKVQTRDGEDAGDVRRVVFDPQTAEVTGFVINSGTLLGRDILVPRSEIERASADGEVIRLQLSKAALDDLPSYDLGDYAAPPAGWVPPAAYGYAPGAYLWPAGVMYGPGFAGPMYGPGYSGYAAPGVGYGGAATAVGAAADSHPDEPAVGKGDTVLDAAGEEVGTVEDVRFDEASGRLRGIVARTGGVLRAVFGGRETVEIPASQIDRVEEGTVRLSVRKDDAPALRD